MARQEFGKTWWGAKWLDALTHIDYDNRLPRGRSYANRGAVENFVIKKDTIHARVQGSRPQPYQVTISVPPTPAESAARLMDEIATDPLLIAHMLNRELSPVALDHATKLGISVFPEKWNDLKMQCSCPDWAVPCKHLAATIYLLSREIDGNPFLVFSLRGMELIAAMKARDIHIEREADAALPALVELLPMVALAKIRKEELAAIDQIDFSRIPDMSESLMRVLPAQPAFFMGGDFCVTMQRVRARVAKAARRALEADVAEDWSRALSSEDRPVMVLDPAFQASVSGAEKLTSLDDLMSALSGVEPSRLPDYQDEVAVWFYVRATALHLLARGAIVPQIYSAEKGRVGLRWLPALQDETVSDIMRRLADGLPALLVTCGEGRQRKAMARSDRAIYLCSIILRDFMRTYADLDKEKLIGNKTAELFFGSGQAYFHAPGEGEIAAGISAWLSRFHLTQREHTLMLCLTAEEGEAAEFSLALAISDDAPLSRNPVPMVKVLARREWEKARYGILQTVSLLTEYLPSVHAYIHAGAKMPIRISPKDLPGLLFDTLPIVRLLGMRILMPKALDQLLRPRLSVQIKGKASASSGVLNAGDIFDFDWKVAVGDQLLTRSEFEKLVKNATQVVRFKGEYVYLDPDAIERLCAQLLKPPVLSGRDLLRLALAGEFGGASVLLDDRARAIIEDLTQAGDIVVPSSIAAVMRPYQERGYAWMVRNARIGLGSVIADDMGLGKTLQVIATLQKLKDDGALDAAGALVIVPTSLLTNWQKEIMRFAPALSVAIFHGSKRELPCIRTDVLLTTYGIARTDSASLNALAWHVLVVDEAQNIKNPAAAQTKAVKAIPAAVFIAMSGTPVENRLSDYWSIMDFANRGYLGNLTQFTREYAMPIQVERDQLVAQRFRRVTAPFLMRRLKSDKSIISDLPEKIEQDQYCTLTKPQAALYESVVREGLKTIAGESETFKRQGLVLQMILALKQICNHPSQYLKQGGGDVSASGKAERFFELIDEIEARHEKVLVFTQFREMGEMLRKWLSQRYGREPLFLHGGVARAKRDAMVERFQNDRTERVFILSLKAGGTGLNLTAASSVIHYDLWWNPAVEAQATDRAYRIGQQRNVQVHRFITTATFEERINDMIRSKRELADLAVATGEKWVGNLGADELKALFALGK